jgi:hypothetical protein
VESWIWIGGALLLGVVLGAAVFAWLTRRDRADQGEVERLRAELEEYREEVTEHFVETAQLVNNLTRSYKAVYDHLEHGAYRLVGDEKLRKELGYVEPEPVKPEYIGRREQSAVLGRSGAAANEPGRKEKPSIDRRPEESAAVPAGAAEAAPAETPQESAAGNGASAGETQAEPTDSRRRQPEPGGDALTGVALNDVALNDVALNDNAPAADDGSTGGAHDDGPPEEDRDAVG